MTAVVQVIPVGPGETERLRLVRLAESIVRHERDLGPTIVVLDRPDRDTIEADLQRTSLPAIFVDNPRGNARCMPPMDGLACGLTAGYAVAAGRFPGAHIWKIDTDAHVIGPCRERIAAFFERHPRAGMIGTLDRNVDGSDRRPDYANLADVHRKALWPAWWWASQKRLSTRFFGGGRRAAAVYAAYTASGGRPGRYAQGGTYALNGATLTAWQMAGKLDDPTAWLGTWLPEDMGFSMWTVIAGFDLADFNAPGEVFAVHGTKLPLSPADLAKNGYGVVHTVKKPTWDEETALVAAIEAALVPAAPEEG